MILNLIKTQGIPGFCGIMHSSKSISGIKKSFLKR